MSNNHQPFISTGSNVPISQMNTSPSMVAFLIHSNHCCNWRKLEFILVNWDCDHVSAEDKKRPEANTGPVHEGKLTKPFASPAADEGGNYLSLLHWHSEWFTCLLFQFQWYMQHSINIPSYCRCSTHRPLDSCQRLKIILVFSTRLHSCYCQKWCSDQLFVCHQSTRSLMQLRIV